MWIFLLIAVAVIIIIVACVSASKNSSVRDSRYSSSSVRYSPPKTAQRIEDCVSAEDVQYQVSHETKRIIANIEASKTAIKNALNAANSTINTAWLNSYEKVIKISSNLDENLEYHARRNLEQTKFQYYTSLHFRSMIAADIVHNELSQINASFAAMNDLIVKMKTGVKTSVPKSQIYVSKDALKDLKNVFTSRRDEMNRRTASFRDKIGNECGERGRQWYAERMKNRG